MADLQVTVRVDKKELQTLRTDLQNLQKDAKEIKIQIKGEQTLKKLTDALSKYSKATTDGTNALIKAKQAEIDLTKAQTNRINAASALARKKQEGINLDKKATLEIEKQATADKKLSAEQEKTAQTANRLATEQTRTERALTKTTTAASKLGDTWKRMFSAFSLSNIVSSGVTRAISQMRSYFNEALNEMKELDTALTHYRQVTGASASEASTLGTKAYSVGSQYGTSAADYAESVATYARAGYKEQADALAELSLKTVIVGQTTQDIADQFLLTMDAAYGYKGSVEELSKVLDGASAIDSNYATTIEKIAAGLGLVAPLAQQVHVSEEELTAAIGTITAVTQRSGAESARALRSLFLNILKDTTTEIEEGVTATEESVADMETLLNRYAKSAVDAAKASGQVINPMEAIGALAKSMKEGILTEKQLMDMMSSLGGKLRVSQLVALVSNWDTYNKMIGTYEDSIGSADEKTRVYLDSWEAKVNILKNTWTEFIAKTIDTDMFKGMLDGATKLLKVFGNLKNAVTLLGGAFAGIKALSAAKQLADVAQAARVAGAEFSQAGKHIQAAAKENESLSASMKSSLLGWAGIATTVITTVYSLYEMYHEKRMQGLQDELDKAEETARVQQEKASEVYEAYQVYYNVKQIYDDNADAADAYQEAVYNLATALGVQETAIKDNISALENLSKAEIAKAIKDTDNALQIAKNRARAELTSFDLTRFHQSQWTVPEGMESKTNAYIPMVAELAGTKDVEKAASIYQDLVKLQDVYLQRSKMDVEQADLYADAYNDLSGVLKDYADILQPVIDNQELLSKYQDQKLAIDTGDIDPQSIDELNSALDNTIDGAEKAEDSFEGLADAISDAKDALEDYQKQTKTEKDDVYTAYADAWKKAYEDIQNGMKNSNAVNAAADLFFTPEQILKMRERGVEVAEVLASDFYKDIFTYINDKGETAFINDDSGSNFLWALYDKISGASGEIKEKLSEVISFTEEDGALSATVQDFDALAESLSELMQLDVDPDVLAAVFQALGMYGEELTNTPGELMAIAESLQAINEAGEIDLENLVRGKLAEGATTNEVAQLKDDILELHQQADSPVKIHVEEGESIDDVKKRIDDLIKNRDELEENPADVKVTADTTQAEKDLEKILLKEQQIEERSPTVTIDVANDKANQKLAETLRMIQILEARSKWLSENTKNVGTNSFKMDTQASGTRNAPGGLTLVNEEAPELIREDGTARIAGYGAPTLTWLQSGAEVYNARETRAILGNSIPEELFYGIDSLAGGSVKGVTRYTPKDSSGKSTKSSTSSTGTGTTSAKSKTTSSKSSSDKDAQLEKLKDIVELRKSELNVLEAQDASLKKQIKKQREIYDALGDQIKYMKEKKYPQKEINALIAEQYKIEKSIASLQKQMYDELGKAVNKRIDDLNKKRDEEKNKIQQQIDALKEKNDKEQKSVELEEKKLAVQEAEEKLANAQRQRTVRYYNAATGQWEWRANAQEVQSAQEALDEAKESLKEYKADQKLEKQIAALEQQQKDIDTKYEKQTDLLQQIIDALEEPVSSIKKAVKNIEKNATKDQETTINALNKLLVAALGKKYKISKKNLYDSGGILQGIGGIKGTTDDEIILPPDITKNMLKPISTAVLSSRMNELRYLYGATGGIAGFTNTNSIGSQHNGDLYSFGNVTLTEGQARSTTVYDLVQMSRGLRAYNAM